MVEVDGHPARFRALADSGNDFRLGNGRRQLRNIDCQQSIEGKFQRLVQNFAAAGWDRPNCQGNRESGTGRQNGEEGNAKMDATFMLARV